jgi:probable rRNA maturation factor
MSHKIVIHANTDYSHAAGILEIASRATLAHEGAAPGELSVVLVGEEQMHQFNLQFADIDAPTDVLAFRDGSIDPDSKTTYHGDVIICYPIADLQASRGGHSISAELSLLTIHGVLHLLGYDHDAQESQAAMWSVQSAILKDLGCEITSPERM